MNTQQTKDFVASAKTHLNMTESEQRILKAIEENRTKLDEKFPFGTAFIATVGLVMVLYGLEKIIDKTFFSEHPWVLVATGVILLFVSGSLYKKL